MTRASVDRDAIAAAVAIASNVVPWAPPPGTVGVQPVGVIRISASAGRLRITSANFNRGLVIDIPSAGDDFTATVPLIPFERWLEKARGTTVDFAPTADQCVITSARSRATLPSTSLNIPPLREPVDEAVTLPAHDLRAGLEAVISIPKDDVTQPYLGGVLIHGGDEGFGFIATDLARVHEIIAAPSAQFRSILPNDTARLLLAILPNDMAPVSITADDRAVAVAWANIRVTSALINGAYPSTASQFDISAPNTLIGRADQLLADFDLVGTVSDSRDREFQLSLGATSIVSAFNAGGDVGEVTLAAEWKGPTLSITFAFRPVRDALQQFGSAEVAWQMSGAFDPTIITAAERPEIRALVAPFIPKLQHERIAA